MPLESNLPWSHAWTLHFPTGRFTVLVLFSSVTPSCLTLCDPMDCSTPGLPVHHQLLELAQTHVHWVDDAIQPSSSVVPFSSRLQSFPASGSFPVSQFFASCGQSIGVSASTSVLVLLGCQKTALPIMGFSPERIYLWNECDLCLERNLCG